MTSRVITASAGVVQRLPSQSAICRTISVLVMTPTIAPSGLHTTSGLCVSHRSLAASVEEGTSLNRIQTLERYGQYSLDKHRIRLSWFPSFRSSKAQRSKAMRRVAKMPTTASAKQARRIATTAGILRPIGVDVILDHHLKTERHVIEERDQNSTIRTVVNGVLSQKMKGP